MGAWDAWIGREELRSDRIDPALAARWLATLDREAPGDGSVPQGLHWCLCLPDVPTARLGRDGHAQTDHSAESFLPPVPLPRRMWASGKVEFLAPLRVGTTVKRTSRVLSVTEKSGGSGPLVFVDIANETLGEVGLAVRETQSLVYRDAVGADAPFYPPACGGGAFEPAEWSVHRIIVPEPPLLFRYSALTFNSHRIHYDLLYARDVERYRGLVVHGPLTATLLLDLARRELRDNTLASFAFRCLSPAFCHEPLNLVMRRGEAGIEMGAFASDGRQIMFATATTGNRDD